MMMRIGMQARACMIVVMLGLRIEYGVTKMADACLCSGDNRPVVRKAARLVLHRTIPKSIA